jgi:hypothetical protein
MPSTSVGQTKMQLPVSKAVGAQHAPASSGAAAAPSVPVPSPSSLFINGRATAAIDVRSMTATDVVNAINNAGIPGVTASIDGQNRLVISGVNSIEGDSNLRAILGV